ncbi:MAG: DNA repair protein RadC [Acholeplasma sp.]|nr:DNA repair protein RadC [Acholeplasma sp.]
MIKEIPVDDRPRERLIKNGAKSLSNLELIAVLLRSGNGKDSVFDLAKKIIEHLEDFKRIDKITYHELILIDGIKDAKATTILAAIELGRRINDSITSKKSITSSDDVYHYMKGIGRFDQETFYCIYLDTKLQIIKYEEIYRGTIDQIIIHPRDIFKIAIKINASNIILVHNHPSGIAKPSKADDDSTRILKESASILGFNIIDHIIIGNNEYYSYDTNKIIKILK